MNSTTASSERVLLIGGAGFLGSALASHLQSLGHFVGVLDFFVNHDAQSDIDLTAIRAYRQSLLKNAQVVQGDATDPNCVMAAFEAIRPTRVGHGCVALYPAGS
jgi:nucleoside-diphosphate-sugar epimerase